MKSVTLYRFFVSVYASSFFLLQAISMLQMECMRTRKNLSRMFAGHGQTSWPEGTRLYVLKE